MKMQEGGSGERPRRSRIFIHFGRRVEVLLSLHLVGDSLDSALLPSILLVWFSPPNLFLPCYRPVSSFLTNKRNPYLQCTKRLSNNIAPFHSSLLW
ncbi:hypothetical protein LEMLEM_LOCUS6862, partial [Lemmus lemmus]